MDHLLNRTLFGSGIQLVSFKAMVWFALDWPFKNRTILSGFQSLEQDGSISSRN
jgi:hypothetical protein